MSQVSQYTSVTKKFTTLIEYGNVQHVKLCNHVNVKVLHVKFEVIRKYFSLCKFDILFLKKNAKFY